ncbi:DUF1161 domain-containing protein [Salinicola rhizosphaerae]|uniref:DUF1161 domain-containing protein n=1 Tax=Salinicola rhizosphaerae TaxID=1443141 RepID=A0ABQ3DPN2_9GAMM|nr:DUF1161 domain-containing protein [Salinicola rhizosphaerae]GHB07539.1 hypothetical protein GCM10009038_00940 [Salinicola rhizosphaerae]
MGWSKTKMTLLAGAVGLCLSATVSWAQSETGESPFDHQPETRLACERLEAQIDQTIRDNGARHFLLEVVDNAQIEDGKVRAGEAFAGAEVVGSCDGGTRKVVYSRHGATEMSEPDDAPGDELPESSGDPVPSESDDGAAAQEPESAP